MAEQSLFQSSEDRHALLAQRGEIPPDAAEGLSACQRVIHGGVLGFNGLSWAAVLLFCAPCALTSGVLSGFSTSLAWWAEHLPEHRLGVFGILLMLFSFVLSIVQPLVDILNIPVH